MQDTISINFTLDEMQEIQGLLDGVFMEDIYPAISYGAAMTARSKVRERMPHIEQIENENRRRTTNNR